MSVALRGSLSDFGIAEVFQLIGQQCKTGLLEIEAKGRKVRLLFDAGAVVWASPAGEGEHAELGAMLVRCGLLTRERLQQTMQASERSARSLPLLLTQSGDVQSADLDQVRDLLTRDAIFEVLRWNQGSFHFSAQAVQHDRPADKLLYAEQILMDGLRMVDEWQIFADQVPGPDGVFKRSGSLDSYRQQAQGDARHRVLQAERVFQLIDGRLSVQRVIDLSRLGTFDATRVLAELRQGGCIEALERSRIRVQRIRSPIRVSSVRGWLAGAFPLALLALLVSLAFREAYREPVGVAITRGPLAAARVQFEKQRLRHALEAERYLTGRWPAHPREVEATGLLPPGALTSTSAAPYYYARREDGLLLLSPEQLLSEHPER